MYAVLSALARLRRAPGWSASRARTIRDRAVVALAAGVIALVVIPGGAGARPAAQAAPAWAALGAVQPLWIAPGASLLGTVMAVDPLNAARLAYCAPGSIQLSNDGGATWAGVPIDAAVQASGATEFSLTLAGQAAPACAAVDLDARAPASLYATFVAVNRPYDAPPPSFRVGYATADAGQTWRPVPVPAGSSMERFGGFQLEPSAAYALFGGQSSAASQAGQMIVEATGDGGRGWQASALPCPASGPCLRWGAAPNEVGSCAMHGYPQAIEYSSDGGQTWRTAPTARSANACQPNQLAALSPTSALLIASGGEEPLRRSTDGGQTWDGVTLPPLPGNTTGVPQFRALQLLPTGALLGLPAGGAFWLVLPPGAAEWCAMANVSLPEAPLPLQVVQDQVWWVSRDNGAASAQHVPQAALTCAGAAP